MPIIGINEVTPKNVRGVVPEKYKGMPYRALSKDDKIVLKSCVFSIYPARDKVTRAPITVQNGPDAGKLVTNCTIYFELDDGHYTSLKNDIVEGQISALTGFDTMGAEVGYYPFDFEPEPVTVVQVTASMGKGGNKKDVPVLAFQQ